MIALFGSGVALGTLLNLSNHNFLCLDHGELIKWSVLTLYPRAGQQRHQSLFMPTQWAWLFILNITHPSPCMRGHMRCSTVSIEYRLLSPVQLFLSPHFSAAKLPGCSLPLHFSFNHSSIYSATDNLIWKWRDGSTVNSTCCSCRGSEFYSQHPVTWFITACNFSSKESDALFPDCARNAL